MMAIAKALIAVVAAVLAAVLPGLVTDTPMGFVGWVNVIILAAGAIHVFNASNAIPGWRYAKLVAAVVAGAGVAIVSALSDGVVSVAEWVQIALAVAGAIGVGVVPNSYTPRHARLD